MRREEAEGSARAAVVVGYYGAAGATVPGRPPAAVVMCTARTTAELIRFHQISAACVAATARPLTPPSQPSGRTWNQQQQQQVMQ